MHGNSLSNIRNRHTLDEIHCIHRPLLFYTAAVLHRIDTVDRKVDWCRALAFLLGLRICGLVDSFHSFHRWYRIGLLVVAASSSISSG